MNESANRDSGPAAYLYRCRVTHRRRVAPFYRFEYRLTYLLVDIDRLDEIDHSLKWFSHNRSNLMSFLDRDHGALDDPQSIDPAPSLRQWSERVLRACGIAPPGGRTRLLCMPRLFGHVFNPISIWYCEDETGAMAAVIVEVNNTFGERHSYVMGRNAGEQSLSVVQQKAKNFHVSPFLDREGDYRFKLKNPDANLRLAINLSRDNGSILDAALSGERRPMNDLEVLKTAISMPLMAFKVVLAIHWQALLIWLRGARFYPKPPPPEAESS